MELDRETTPWTESGLKELDAGTLWSRQSEVVVGLSVDTRYVYKRDIV